MASALFVGWVAYKLTNRPMWLDAHPILDFVMGYIALDLYMLDRKRWKLGVLGCTLLMQVCHVVYQVALVYGNKLGYAYAAALNVLFLCQLLLVSSMGLKASGRIVGDWLSDYVGGARDYAHRFTTWRRQRK